ncbi:MAG TPA: hypothetical protein VK066_02830 [Chloroflexota bacterium]|nr:hypothetical protein [Chloroflexota bacterium]
MNERGIRVQGAWYNVSQYRPVALPLRGQHGVRDMKGKGMERCEVLDTEMPRAATATG